MLARVAGRRGARDERARQEARRRLAHQSSTHSSKTPEARCAPPSEPPVIRTGTHRGYSFSSDLLPDQRGPDGRAPATGAVVERPVTIPTSDGMRLSGTLTVPAGPGPYPAVVFVGGFGPDNRDGDFDGRGRRGYRQLALGLARRGVAVLRYDKRGIGASEGPRSAGSTPAPSPRDAGAAARRLASLPGIDTTHVALVGHSQGGDLALEAARTAPVTRVVTLSAPGRPLGVLPRVPGSAAAGCSTGC